MGEHELYSRSFRLFSLPRGLFGAARLIDLGGRFTQYNTNADGHEADLKALRADWEMVGNDMAVATERVGQMLGHKDRIRLHGTLRGVAASDEAADMGTQLSIQDA